MNIISPEWATPENLEKVKNDYIILTDLLGIPRRDSKDAVGTRVIVLGHLVDTVAFEVSVPRQKLDKVVDLTTKALSQSSISLIDIQSLTGLLSWCAPAVQLGWLFCRRLWTLIASFGPNATSQWKKRITHLVKQDIL